MDCTICTVKYIICPQTLDLSKEKLAIMRKKKLLMPKKSDGSEHIAVGTTEDHQGSVQRVEI